MNQFELDLGVPIDESKLEPNPMVKTYGYGPEGKRCKHCSHLFKKQYAGTYYKCDQRLSTNGSGTDQRVNWQLVKNLRKGSRNNEIYPFRFGANNRHRTSSFLETE